MALELLANFERTSHNSLFYRLTSANPYSLTLRLSDLNLTNIGYTDYFVKLWLNDGENNPIVDQEFNTLENFYYPLSVDCLVPCLCTFHALASSSTGQQTTFSLSVKFLSNYPTATFVAYPSAFLSGSNLVELTPSNYLQNTPGVFFYGEGHTETIFLSANTRNASATKWYIGNSVNQIQNNTSLLSVVSQNLNTASVKITSDLANQNIFYPVSLWVTNADILTSGPLYHFNDSTGEKSFYPFFVSTRNVNNNSVPSLTSKFFSDIEVKTYPFVQTFSLQSPFPTQNFALPVTLQEQYFTGVVLQNFNAPTILNEAFYGTTWKLEAEANPRAPTPDWETITPLLPFISAYQFPLSYENKDNIESTSFKASIGFDTSITVTVSAYKLVRLTQATDWKTKIQTSSFTDSAVVNPLPVARLYTPNHYNLVGSKVKITNADTENASLIRQVTVKGTKSTDVLEFSGADLFKSKTMTFNGIGSMTLSATTVFVDGSNQEYTITYQFPDFLEVVDYYDEENENYYTTPITLTNLRKIKAPRLTPNEWVTNDNVNSIIEKVYQFISELELYTKFYKNRLTFNGRNEQVTLFSWSDLKCSQNSLSSTAFWWSALSGCDDVFHPANEFGHWDNHTCTGDESFVDFLCKRKDWLAPTVNLVDFSTITDFEVSECSYTGLDKFLGEEGDFFIVSYPTRVQLFANDYKATFLAQRSKADEVFNFSNIVAVRTTFDKKVVVLDSNLPRVSIFTIDENNSFNLFATWGRFGLQQNLQGFNKPEDLCIDSENRIWICDTGNNCIKKYTLTGKNLLVLTSPFFDNNPPISMCIDSQGLLHILTSTKIYVFDKSGNYQFDYEFPVDVIEPKKIQTSFNKEIIYLSYKNGVAKFFRNGIFFDYTLKDLKTINDTIVDGYQNLFQDEYRNLYVTVKDQIFKVGDLMRLTETKAQNISNLSWKLSDLLIDKEEYVQPWVYLKAFHRLWDNIELLRNSLFYEETGCKTYTASPYTKQDLVLGQNEIVTNSTINRLAQQLWINLQSLIDYFDTSCIQKTSFVSTKPNFIES